MAKPSNPIDQAQRLALARLIAASGEDYASLSRMLGRNASYIQQFMKRGAPRKLAEDDRRRLAGHFGIGEEELGGPPRHAGSHPSLVTVPAMIANGGVRLRGGMDPGSSEDLMAVVDRHRLSPVLVDGLARLSRVMIADDALAPDLLSGDEVIIDLQDDIAGLRDGIYALKIDSAPCVRRITVTAQQQQVIVSGNNSCGLSSFAYKASSLPLLGRAIWMSRRLP